MGVLRDKIRAAADRRHVRRSLPAAVADLMEPFAVWKRAQGGGASQPVNDVG
jgi:hypothetical protein